MFIIVGVCNIGATFHIYKNKEIPNIYVIALTLGFLTAAVITGYIPFAIGNEAGELT